MASLRHGAGRVGRGVAHLAGNGVGGTRLRFAGSGNFFDAIGPFLTKGLSSNITGYLATTIPPVDAVDQETAAAQQVADSYGVPFLGIRGISDGPGDALRLPDIPFLQFFVYGQLAAGNAATVAEAFLQTWTTDAPA
ncbi:purine or other phosphorylase family 1 [Mycolicibacterium rhodesiae JS60]|nr:purine or other phosphorylase family 1 [Mycolicibacterium rhodesiae JS60]